MKVLVTGGAGYIGTTLIPMLLQQGHQVRALDNLSFGGDALLPNFANPHFEFLLGDVRDEARMRQAIQGMDVIIHLAAIVGYPACKQEPILAEQVNLDSVKLLHRLSDPKQVIFFGSTSSIYGAVTNGLCTEETPAGPLTIYGRTKWDAEKVLRERGNAVIYRFATAFGVSPRMRLDLLINDFAYRALRQRNLIVYEKKFRRAFIHVRDICRSYLFALEDPARLTGQVFNIGAPDLNLSKEDIALKLKEKLDFFLHFADYQKDEDQRNYNISYDRIYAHGFKTSIGLEEGLGELLRAFEVIRIHSPYGNV